MAERKEEPTCSAEASTTYGSTDAAEPTRVSSDAKVTNSSESPLADQCSHAGYDKGNDKGEKDDGAGRRHQKCKWQQNRNAIDGAKSRHRTNEQPDSTAKQNETEVHRLQGNSKAINEEVEDFHERHICQVSGRCFRSIPEAALAQPRQEKKYLKIG